MKNKNRIIILNELLTYKGNSQGKINWSKCIGCKVGFVYDDVEGFFEIIDYNKVTRKLLVKYINCQYEILTNNLVKCNLGNILGKYKTGFKVKIGTRFKDDKRDITITDKECRKDKQGNNIKWYKYTCNVCGWTEGWIREYGVLKNQGCGCCHGLVAVLGINTIYDTDTWMIPLIGEECAKTHTHGSNDKVKVTCPDCGRIKEMIINNIYKKLSIGCQCGDGFSYGHKYIFNLLIQLNQKFVDNHTFDWCKFYNTYKQKEVNGEYDFVLEDLKYIIEIDGGFHRQDNKMSGQTKEESKFIDDEKDRLAIEHGYKVIRISDEGNIKQNILKSDLNILFNLSNIDWLNCGKFALSNKIKEACELKRNNPELFASDIAKLMNIGVSTIIGYLKKGNELDWCYYNSKEEKIRSGKENGQKVAKKIEVFKDKESLGVFKSIKYLVNASEKIFGIKITKYGINRQIKNNLKPYKGFRFLYCD